MGQRNMIKTKSSELEKRVDLISRAVCQGKGASQQRRSLLNKLKDKLTSRTPYPTFADPRYVEQFTDTKRSELKALDLSDAFFLTVNIMDGKMPQTRKTVLLSPSELLDFNISQQLNSLRKRLEELKNACGYITAEVKYDERFDAFIPHFHILIFGTTEKDLEQWCERFYCEKEEVSLSPSFLKKHKKVDPYLLYFPVSLKPYLIEKVKTDNVGNYMTKCATYCKKYVPYRCRIREDKKHPHVRPPLNASIEHLLWLDQLSQKYVMTPFHVEKLNAVKSNFTGENEKNDDGCVKTGQRREGLGGSGERSIQNNTVVTPIKTRKGALRYLGYTSFREAQEDAVNFILKKKRSLLVLKTSFGKSLCFAVAALKTKGVCVILEPLIAVMENQVEKLNRQNQGIATTVNSNLSPTEKQKNLTDTSTGKVKGVFVSPETLKNKDLQSALCKVGVGLFVVDEAHCIDLYARENEKANDKADKKFRPDYGKLLKRMNKIAPDALVTALTGSIDKSGKKLIYKELDIPKGNILMHDLDRPEISYEVMERKTTGMKPLCKLIKPHIGKDTVLIFCAYRDHVTAVSTELKKRNIDCCTFLGGDTNNTEVLAKAQEKPCVIVATKALGMGVDIPNVRLVVHIDAPVNLIEYVQETGRAARNGEDAKAVILYRKPDLSQLKRDFCRNKIDHDRFEKVVQFLNSSGNRSVLWKSLK